MAVYKNSVPFGSIVTDGLVLNLDATNINSYPGSGTTWTDTSFYRNNGTLTNGPTFLRERGRGSIIFDGVDDRVQIADYNYGRSGFTVEAWFKFNVYSTTGYKSGIVAKWQTGAGTNNEFFLGSEGSSANSPYWPGFGIQASNNVVYFIQDTSIIQTSGSWYQQVGTFDGSYVRLYLNGNLRTTSSLVPVSTIATITAQPITIASFGSSFQYSAPLSVSNTKIYNRALSAQEVQQNYNALKSRFGL